MHVKLCVNETAGGVIASSDEHSLTFTRTEPPNTGVVIVLLLLGIIPGVLYLLFGGRKSICNFVFRPEGKQQTTILIQGGPRVAA